MSRAGVYQFFGESCPRSNCDRLSIPRTGGEVGGPTLDHGATPIHAMPKKTAAGRVVMIALNVDIAYLAAHFNVFGFRDDKNPIATMFEGGRALPCVGNTFVDEFEEMGVHVYYEIASGGSNNHQLVNVPL